MNECGLNENKFNLKKDDKECIPFKKTNTCKFSNNNIIYAKKTSYNKLSDSYICCPEDRKLIKKKKSPNICICPKYN